MDIVRVRYFLAVCDHGSFTAAAKACRVSQPSVTTAIRRLERAIGARLFERRHPVRLTPLGALLRPLFQDLQSSADRIAAVVGQSPGGPAHALAAGRPGRGATRADAFDAHRRHAGTDGAKAVAPPFDLDIRAADPLRQLIRRSDAAIARADSASRRLRSILAQDERSREHIESSG